MALLCSPQSPQDFTASLRAHLAPSGVQADHYEGWFWGNFFSIGYVSAGAAARKYHPVRNRILGWVRPTDQGCQIRWFRFQGCTDPISLTTLYLGSLLFLVLIRRLGGIVQGELGTLAQYSGIFTLAVAGLTWLSTTGSREGAQGREQLEKLMK